jgi:hypothetical protein
MYSAGIFALMVSHSVAVCIYGFLCCVAGLVHLLSVPKSDTGSTDPIPLHDRQLHFFAYLLVSVPNFLVLPVIK